MRTRTTESGARAMPAGHAIIAAVVAVVLVAGANLAGALDHGEGGDASSFDFGAGTTVAAAEPAGPDDTAAAAADEPPPTGGTTLPTATADSVSETAVEDVSTVPTGDDPAKVYIAGDSDAGNLGPPLQDLLADTGVVDSELFYKVSSGLSRPDFFDWPAQLQRDIATHDPDIVVVTFGGNDAQDIEIDGRSSPVDTPEWRAEYTRRVGAVMEFLTQSGRTLVWVGIPNAKSGTFRDRLNILQQVTKDEAALHPGVRYVDTWNRFVGASGGYADYIIDPRATTKESSSAPTTGSTSTRWARRSWRSMSPES